MEYQPELNGKYTPFFTLHGCQYFIQVGEISLPYGQGRIQTTSTYANAEVTTSVVKLLKNTGIPVFSTIPPNYCLLFFCLLKKLEILRPRVCRGYSAEAVEDLCMPAMR